MDEQGKSEDIYKKKHKLNQHGISHEFLVEDYIMFVNRLRSFFYPYAYVPSFKIFLSLYLSLATIITYTLT